MYHMEREIKQQAAGNIRYTKENNKQRSVFYEHHTDWNLGRIP
jgi:hypothetical protein